MKILLLGATGRTGQLALQIALSKGYKVNCLSRNIKRISPQSNLTLFEGNPANKSDLEKALKDCTAIISILNISRTSDFPWSKLRTPPTYLSDVMKVLIPVAQQHNIKRVTICSAWGVEDTVHDIPWWFKWTIEKSNISVAYKDHERQERLLTSSSLDWTIVRPVGLTSFKSKESIRETFNKTPQPSLLISRKSVATYLVDSLENEDLVHKKVVISKG